MAEPWPEFSQEELPPEEGAYYPWQLEGERLLTLSRRHPYFLISRLLLPAAVLSVPLALAAFGLDFNGVATLYLFLGPGAVLLFLFFYWSWQHNYYALTDRRILHVEETPFIYQEHSEAELERVQDLRVTRPDWLSRLLGYGDLQIETAGTGGIIEFHGLPDAEGFARDVLQAKEGAVERRPSEEVGILAEPAPAARRPESPHRDASVWEYFVPRVRVEEGSKIVWRKHWYILLGRIVGPLAGLLIALEVGVGAALNLPLPWVGLLPRSTTIWAAIALASALALLILYHYADWRNDIYVLTEDRIIDIDKKPLMLREERREASLAMVQNVKYIIPGILSNLLNVGNVMIETAATEGEFTFDGVHDPRRVQGEIFARLEAYRQRERERERQARLEELRELLSAARPPEGEAPQ